jgi:DNA gyrase subunit A
VYQLPEAGSNARGRPIINWIPLEPGEKVQAVVPVRAYEEGRYVFFATKNGTVKKTPLTEFAFKLARGKIAINLDEGDALVGVALTDGERDIMMFASNGRAVRFSESLVRAMGRTATGVRGMRLVEGADADVEGDQDEGEAGDVDGVPSIPEAGSEVVSLVVVDGEGDILTASERGYGKRTPVADYPRKGRGTRGVIALKTTERNGRLVGAIQLSDHHEVLLISDGGTLVRTRAAEISQVGRNTQGVTLIRLSEGETLQAVERLDASLDEDEGVEGVVVPAPAAAEATDTPPEA